VRGQLRASAQSLQGAPIVGDNVEVTDLWPAGASGRIVVGVDGSEHSLLALRWAAQEAVRTGAELDVVTAWLSPEHAAPLGVVPKVLSPDELVAEAGRKLDELVAEVLPDTSAVVHTEVVRGEAAASLVARARGADLLVVGSRGRGLFADLLLGSVSEHCVRHAPCPVVVVRESGHR